jgi:hypothetical protein
LSELIISNWNEAWIWSWQEEEEKQQVVQILVFMRRTLVNLSLLLSISRGSQTSQWYDVVLTGSH